MRGAGGRRCQHQRRKFNQLKISGSSTVPRIVICCSAGRTGQLARHWRAPLSTPMRENFSTVQLNIKLQVASLCIVAGRTGRRARRWRALSSMPARAGRARCRPAPWACRSPRPPAPPSTRSRVCFSQPRKAPLVALTGPSSSPLWHHAADSYTGERGSDSQRPELLPGTGCDGLPVGLLCCPPAALTSGRTLQGESYKD